MYFLFLVLRQRVFPWTYNALSLMHYHVAAGWHHSAHFRGLQLLPSHYYGLKPLRITGRSKQDVSMYDTTLHLIFVFIFS